MAEQKTGMSTGRKVMIGMIVVLFVLTVGAYFFGVYYFTGHFLPGSQVNGFNCSYMTEAQTEELLERQTSVYALAIRTRGDGQESLRAEEISLKYSSDGSVKNLLHSQNRFGWFMAFSQQQVYELSSSVTYDEMLFEEKLNSLKCMQDQQEPSDAYIRENDDGFEVVSEIEGTKIDRDRLYEDIREAVTTGRTVADLEADGCYTDPEVYAEDLAKDCQQMNELTDVVVTYDFSDRKETIDRSVLKDWLTRDENNDLILDIEAVSDFVAQIADKYNTVGTERSFLTYDDQIVSISGGNYGWVIDQEKETEALYQTIKECRTEVREPVYTQEASSRDTNDIGYSYIEIDLTHQRMVLYQNGSPIVDTGFLASSSTPDGIFVLGQKEESAVPDDYDQTVYYWMPFDEKLGIYGVMGLDITGMDLTEGFVDFGSSGENVFSSLLDSWMSTSGCIALPEEQARMIYENVNAGLPVVIYHR